jgi:hypothetical protein
MKWEVKELRAEFPEHSPFHGDDFAQTKIWFSPEKTPFLAAKMWVSETRFWFEKHFHLFSVCDNLWTEPAKSIVF